MALAEHIFQQTYVNEMYANDSREIETITIPREVSQVSYLRFSIITIFLVVTLSLVTILSYMRVVNKNQELQQLKTEVLQIQQENNVLMQSVQELSQYDRVMKIAEEQGLQMNEDNVRNVEP